MNTAGVSAIESETVARAAPYSTTSDRTEPSAATRRNDLRIWLPALILIAVAILQVALAKSGGLSPWKGGGFGMFATTDGSAFRHVRVFVEAPGRTEEVEIAPSQDFAASRAQLFPSDAMMSRLAQAVIAREKRHGRPVQTVRLEIWRTEFAPGSLEATERQLRVLTLDADQTPDNAR